MSSRWIILILLLAFGVRLIVGLRLGLHRELGGDEASFYSLTQNLARLNEFSVSSGKPTATKAPLYPLLMSFVLSTFGDHRWVFILLQAAIGTLTVIAVWLLTRLLGNVRLALCAAGVAAADPFLVHFSGQLLSEPLFICLATWVIYYLCKAQEEKGGLRSAAILAGFLSGLATLARFTFALTLLGLPILALLRPHPFRRRALDVGLTMGIGILVLMPWWIRNYRVFNRFIFTTTHGGWTFWEGLCPDFDRRERLDLWLAQMQREAGTMNELERDAYFWKKSKDWVYSHPREYAGLTLRKFLKFWRLVPYEPYGKRERVVSAVYFIPWLFLVLSGLYLTRFDWRRFLPIYLFVGTHQLAHLLFWTQIRYRVPLVPVLSVFAAVALERCLRSLGVLGKSPTAHGCEK